MDDLEPIVALMREYYEFDGLVFNEVRSRRALATLLGHRALGRVWLILDGDTPVGYAGLTLGFSLEYQGRDALVDETYLRASTGAAESARACSLSWRTRAAQPASRGSTSRSDEATWTPSAHISRRASKTATATC